MKLGFLATFINANHLCPWIQFSRYVRGAMEFSIDINICIRWSRTNVKFALLYDQY